MPQVNTGSDLIEVELTPQEIHVAMQLMDKALSLMYLQNSRVEIFRQLATMEYSDPSKDAETHRHRAYLKGQYDILGNIIDGALNPAPIPINDGEPSPLSNFPS